MDPAAERLLTAIAKFGSFSPEADADKERGRLFCQTITSAADSHVPRWNSDFRLASTGAHLRVGHIHRPFIYEILQLRNGTFCKLVVPEPGKKDLDIRLDDLTAGLRADWAGALHKSTQAR